MTEGAGTQFVNLPKTGLLQLDNQSDYHLAAMRRNAETGSLELISFMKNVYLRLDEFITEYDQPSYIYEGQQMQSKEFQNMMIKDLGKPEFVKK